MTENFISDLTLYYATGGALEY